MPQNPKILLVDDNAETLRLQQRYYEITAITSRLLRMGVRLWQRKKDFDLIVLDIMMSGMDGFQVCTLLKKQSANQQYTYYFLTGRTDSESVLQTFNAGGEQIMLQSHSIAWNYFRVWRRTSRSRIIVKNLKLSMRN